MDLIPRVRVNPPSVALQIIAAQEEMLRKERELDEARKKLAQIRQQQYKFLPSELREDHSWLAAQGPAHSLLDGTRREHRVPLASAKSVSTPK